MLKALLWLIRSLLPFVPGAVIGVWGYSYLKACGLELLAPNKPVEFRYKGAGGEVAVRADSYSISPRAGLVSVYGLSVHTPSGASILLAKQIEVSHLDLTRGANQSPKIDVYRLSGSLIRLANGKFQLEELLPTQTGTSQSRFPFSVTVHKADVVLKDLKGSRWVQRVRSETIDVLGAGADWVAQGQAELPGVGSVKASIQNASQIGLQISGKSSGLEVESFLHHVLTDRSLHILDKVRDAQFDKVRVSGPFRLFVSSKLQIGVDASVNATATAVAWNGYGADHVAFSGIVSQNAASGTANVAQGANRIQATGSVIFRPVIEANAKVSLLSPNPSTLPSQIIDKFPKGISYKTAKFDGWVSAGKGKPPTVQGTLVANQIIYRNEVASNFEASIGGTPKAIRADIRQVSVANSHPTGSVQIDLGKKSLVGYVQGENLDLAHIGSLTHTQGLSGRGSVRALVSGTLDRPLVQFDADGSGAYRQKNLSVGPDRVQVSGSFQNKLVHIRRGVIQGVDGLVTVSGQTSAAGSSLDMDVEARNIQLSKFLPDASGLITASGRVVGDYQNPHATGTVRAIDIAYKGQRVPVATADFLADRNRVVATNIGAVSGTMDLKGGASMTLKDRKLKGQFSLTGLELAQFAGERAAGIVDAPTVQLNGTLTHPTVAARLEGRNLVAGDVLIDSVEAFVTANTKTAVVDHATANFAGGSISANGSYDIDAKSGDGVITSTSLDLAKLAPALGQSLTLTGSASIQEAKVAFKDGAISGTASGKLDTIVANSVPVGDGNWTVTATGDTVNGTLSIGQLEPVLRVVDVDATYNLKDKSIKGTFDADRAHLQDLLSASLRYLPENLTNNPDLFHLTGDLTVGASFSGPVAAPNLSIDTFALSSLRFKDAPFGDITASKITRQDQVWTVPDLSLKGPEGSVTASGTVAENGKIDAKVTGSDIKASAFGALSPSLITSTAVGKFQIAATGDTKNPDVQANLRVDHLVQAPHPASETKSLESASTIKFDHPLPVQPTKTAITDTGLWVNVPNIQLANGALSLDGTYGFDGFAGSFNGSAPFSYNGGLGSKGILAHLKLDKRELKDLPFIDTLVDPSRSQGSMSGDITATGPLSDLRFDGGISLSADTLAFRSSNPTAYIKRIDDELKSVKASLSLSDSKTLAFSLDSGVVRGGQIGLKANVPLPDFDRLFSSNEASIRDQILHIPISGQVDLKSVQLRQSLPGGFMAATLSGQTPIGGTVQSPAIGLPNKAGVFTLSDVDTTLPALPTGTGATSVLAIDPTFNLTARLSNAAHAKSATAEVSLTGDASLKGSLSEPQARADLSVPGGSVRLPGGTVRLTPGGTLHFAYEPSFAAVSSASFDVDLQGKTSITAIRYGQNTQRYDITVYITGDVLQANGLHFDAISDPPDLSPDDVLNLLGQKDLLQSLGGADQGEAEARVRDALVGFAIPSVLDPYTSTLAKNLGLDYISLEYNSVNLATVGVARSLGPDLTLQYRQQVGTPPPGYRAIYDFRLVFNPRKGPPLFRRFSLSVGTDQDRPWKIALEYGSRFGGYSGPAVRNLSILSSPTKP